MIFGLNRRGLAASAVAFLAAGLACAPGEARPLAVVPVARPLPAQAEPAPIPTPDAEVAPEDLLPPPILPAPDLPSDDPVVELPPEGEPPPPATAGDTGVPAVPGLPATAAGTVFGFADLAEQLLDSVVYISTAQRVEVSRPAPLPDRPDPPTPNPPTDEFFDEFFNNDRNDPRTVQSLGSGFVIDGSGLIVTNNHVIADADEIVANFANGRKLTATVVGIDDKTDLALLKVTSPSPLPSARFGRSERLRVGDWVLAIGNPFGFGGTVTAGIVSALDRDINSGPYDHYIQTDASINRGNSGGPLFNLGGEVVGINTAIMSPTGGSIGIGFAVPAEIAVPVIEQLREFGEVRRGWIGVRIQEVTDEFAEGLDMLEATGALIAGLTEKGPADEAGIEEGDVVVEFAGKAVESMRALPRAVADVPPGETVDVVVLRNGERVTLRIKVGLLEDEQLAAVAPAAEEGDDLPADQPGAAQTPAEMFGLTLGAITDEARKTFSIEPDVTGVLVTEVESGSEAEEKSLVAGDVIVQVSQRDVAAPEEVSARIEQLKAEGRRTVMLLVSGSDKKMRFVSLRFDDVQ